MLNAAHPNLHDSLKKLDADYQRQRTSIKYWVKRVAWVTLAGVSAALITFGLLLPALIAAMVLGILLLAVKPASYQKNIQTIFGIIKVLLQAVFKDHSLEKLVKQNAYLNTNNHVDLNYEFTKEALPLEEQQRGVTPFSAFTIALENDIQAINLFLKKYSSSLPAEVRTKLTHLLIGLHALSFENATTLADSPTESVAFQARVNTHPQAELSCFLPNQAPINLTLGHIQSIRPVFLIADLLEQNQSLSLPKNPDDPIPLLQELHTALCVNGNLSIAGQPQDNPFILNSCDLFVLMLAQSLVRTPNESTPSLLEKRLGKLSQANAQLITEIKGVVNNNLHQIQVRQPNSPLAALYVQIWDLLQEGSKLNPKQTEKCIDWRHQVDIFVLALNNHIQTLPKELAPQEVEYLYAIQHLMASKETYFPASSLFLELRDHFSLYASSLTQKSNTLRVQREERERADAETARLTLQRQLEAALPPQERAELAASRPPASGTSSAAVPGSSLPPTRAAGSGSETDLPASTSSTNGSLPKRGVWDRGKHRMEKHGWGALVPKALRKHKPSQEPADTASAAPAIDASFSQAGAAPPPASTPSTPAKPILPSTFSTGSLPAGAPSQAGAPPSDSSSKKKKSSKGGTESSV